MKFRVIMGVFLATLIMVFTPVCLQAKGISEATMITVQGASQTDVAPDIAFVQLAVTTTAVTVAEAQEENARLTNKVYERLEATGVGKDYIKTVQFSVVPLYQPEDGKKTGISVIRGYQVTNSFAVTIAPNKAGEIIDIALLAGANGVQNIRFGKQDELTYKNIVIQGAVRDALNKAETIASVLGKRVSRVQSVTETGIYIQNPELGGRYNLKMAEASATLVSPGLVHLNANVQVIVEVE